MTSQLQNWQKIKKCCDSENIADMKNALSGIMANELKFPLDLLSGKNYAGTFYTFSFRILQRFKQNAHFHSTVDLVFLFGPNLIVNPI